MVTRIEMEKKNGIRIIITSIQTKLLKYDTLNWSQMMINHQIALYN